MSLSFTDTQEIISACCLLRARFLISLFFDSDDEGDIFLRNVG
jgi:hypothetical protein